MSGARDFLAHDVLRNGTEVTIRAVRPEDRDALVKAFASLERDTIYRRFFAFRRELTPAELARLGTMDFVREAMLVATIPTQNLEVVIGSARYIAHEGNAAEIAFVIEEDYQGLGLAGRLLGHLATLARTSGIARFEAEVLPENKGMLRVFARSGLPMRQRRADGVMHVTLDLAAGRAPGP